MKNLISIGLLLSTVLLFPNPVFSSCSNKEQQDSLTTNCDIIILKNRSEQKAKVLEIGTSEIKYKKCDYIDGPTISILKSDVFMIKYSDGTKEVIISEGLKKGNMTSKGSPISSVSPKPQKTTLPSVLSIGVGWSLVGFLKRTGSALYDPNTTNPNSANFNPYNKLDYSSTPVLAGSYDFGVSDIFTIGVAASYQSFTEKYSSTRYKNLLVPSFKIVTTRTNFAIRPLFHINSSDKFDLYGGLRIGYTIWNHEVSSDKIKVEFDTFEQDGFALQGILGVRYYFNDFMGVGLELSIGSPYFTMIGANFKF